MLREEEFDARGNRQVPRGFFVGPDEVFRIVAEGQFWMSL
jgi:hypothetical protein